MANKIKDTDYLAISARVRAMETTLLTAERMERLLEAGALDVYTVPIGMKKSRPA